MERNLSRKVVVITGGVTGIGFEIADKYLKNGAKVCILLDMDEKQGEKATVLLSTKYGADRVVFLKCDVTTDIEETCKKIFEEYKTVDVLVNSAGIANESIPRKVINVNLTALVEWSLKFFEHMRKDRRGNGGTIINVSSIWGFRIDKFCPVYHATKFGIWGFSKSLGHIDNYNRTGVRVVVICPGFTRTNMTNCRLVTLDDHTDNEMETIRDTIVFQDTDVVGEAAVEVFIKADTGTVWVIEESKPVERIS